MLPPTLEQRMAHQISQSPIYAFILCSSPVLALFLNGWDANYLVVASDGSLKM